MLLSIDRLGESLVAAVEKPLASVYFLSDDDKQLCKLIGIVTLFQTRCLRNSVM